MSVRPTVSDCEDNRLIKGLSVIVFHRIVQCCSDTKVISSVCAVIVIL